MSVVLMIFTGREQVALKRRRPAWNEIKLGSSFAYFREDMNTDWIRLNSTNHLSNIDELASTLAVITAKDFIKGALIQMNNRESVDDALARGFEMKPTSSRDAVKINTAFV